MIFYFIIFFNTLYNGKVSLNDWKKINIIILKITIDKDLVILVKRLMTAKVNCCTNSNQGKE